MLFQILNRVRLPVWGGLIFGCFTAICPGAVYNLKIVTDASPDYSDMSSMVRSITSKWETPEKKCWAMFYWNHIARRQTAPMVLHGMALTDPIRQFNDYGYTMCSTISGINCAIWDAMGLKTKYWDISLHTVPEVEYDGAWHMYDNSMTAIYTLCDGKTIAGVQQIGQKGACAASDGVEEAGHIAKYHCLMGTSPRGFLTGADTIRALDEEYRCFNPNGLKYRSYFYDWDRGHRYILNLREHESYTRTYHSLGKTAEYYVPNGGKDPEKANERYHVRGNGVRIFRPALTVEGLQTSSLWSSNLVVSKSGGVSPARVSQPAEVVFKVEGANVITALKIGGKVFRKGAEDASRIEISTVNGLAWKTVWESDKTGETSLGLKLGPEVNGSYEVLVKCVLQAKEADGAELRNIEFETTTMLNSKTQPKLALGKNTIYVGVGPQTESIVFWPDLQGTNAQPYIVEQKNIATAAKHPGYMGVLSAAKPGEAYVVFRMDAPRDFARIEYGGRFYNRARGSQIDLSHSFDGGKSWSRSYLLTSTAQPWDVIHYETVDSIPSGTRAVLFKYRMQCTVAGKDACSIYAMRMEGNHLQLDHGNEPLQVTFNWSERQPDYSLVERSHTEVIRERPHRYTINVGGVDHPVVNFLSVEDSSSGLKPGYSDGRDAGGEKFTPRWVAYGKNLARGKPYKVSVPSNNQWGAGDPDGKKLTDGVAGPPYPGATAPGFAACWDKGKNPEITVDLGKAETCGAFRIQLGAGWPWWDAMKGQVKDKVEVLSSLDGQTFQSHGFVNLNLRWKDLPVNHFWPDEETLDAHLFEHILPAPVQARYVQFKITPQRTLTVSEVEVLDSIEYRPFDLRLALPDEPLAKR